MKKVEDIKKYREMKVDQLQALVLDLEKEMMHDTLKIKAGKMNNFSVVSKVRKNIARIKTIINEQEAE